MSENKDKNLPGEDYFRTYKGNDGKKREHIEVTQQEKEEFDAAFSDEEMSGGTAEAEDGTVAFNLKSQSEKAQDTAQEKAENVPENTAPDYSAEDLYKLPEFNADEFFASLPNGKPQKQEEKLETVTVHEESVDESEKTDDVKLADDSRGKDKKEGKPSFAEKTVAFKKLKGDGTNTKSFESTQLFSLKKQKGASKDKKKTFIQNFRVLSKEKEDRAILEATPVGKGGKGFADSVKAEKGEGIFDAVEKAYTDKSSAADSKSAAEVRAKKKRQHYKAGLEKSETIKKELTKKFTYAQISIYILTVIFAMSFIMTVFFSKAGFYPVISIIMLIASVAVSFKFFLESFKNIKSFTAAADTALFIMCFFALFHNISAMVLSTASSLYTLPVIFACLARSVAEFYKCRSKYRYVSLASKGRSLSVLQGISVKSDTSSSAKNVGDEGEANIFYCSEADLDTAVEEPKFDSTKENKYYIFSICLVLLSALVMGFISFVTEKTGFSFITCLTATVCMLIPVIYDPLSRFFFYNEGDGMFKLAAAVSSREALSKLDSAEGFVLDASDVFTGEVTRFRKSSLSSISQSDSAVFAAILLKAAGSILAPCFDSFIEQMKITLPEAEDLQYEERLGYSAWVLDRKILVGNRKMLESHSIAVPPLEHEKAYGKGKFVMYVVIDGEITATFLVAYKVISSLEKYAKDFNKTGYVLMLSSREAFLDEKVVANKLRVDIAGVKVLSSKAAAIMERYNNNQETQTPTGLLFSRGKRSFMHLVMGAFNMQNNDKLLHSLSVLGQILGFILIAAALFIKIPAVLNPVFIVAIRAVWIGVIILVFKIKKSRAL